MPLTKQPISINFSQGLDLKTDPFQVQAGKFLALSNSIFTTAGQLTKRNGFGPLAALPNEDSTFLTTFNGNLTAIGTELSAYSSSANEWITKGTLQPAEVSVISLIKTNTNQSQVDTAISSSGLACTVYTDNVPVGYEIVQEYKYVIADSVTGQNIITPTIIPVSSGTVTGSPRVFFLGKYFIIVFTNVISSTPHLQYIAINSTNPLLVTSNADIASSYVPVSTLSWDGFVANNRLFIAYNTTTGGQAIKVAFLTPTLSLSSAVTFSSQIATMMSVTADISSSSPIIYASYYDAAGSTAHTLAVDYSLNTVLSPTETLSSGTVLNITSIAQSGTMTVYFEYANNYGYDTTIPTHYIESKTITQAGSVGSLTPVVRSVGLASKAFIINSVPYMLTAYQSPYQPTYFLINGSGNVISKIAYENGGGYYTTGLPSVSISGDIATIPYLFKDLIQAVNKATNLPSGTQINGVYSQTGLNLVSFTLTTSNISSSEIGSNLNISGGIVWAYDGYAPVEQGFFLYPDSIEATGTTISATPTANLTNGSNVLTNVSSAGLLNAYIGLTVTGTDIPANSYITAINATAATITISNAVTGSATAETITYAGNVANQQYYYQVTYEWSDNQGNLFRSAPSIPITITTSGDNAIVLDVPTLRLTYKTSSPVKIVIYRWSVAQQNYYQVTSINLPILNITSSDYITFTDVLSDAQILGNNIIYTTGGVLEDVAPPPTSITTLFNNRLWVLDAEDTNLLWFSKQVIEATPVEMSDLLTMYIAPTTSAQGSTGPITALSAMDDKLIIFKENAIYYLNGIGPDNTGANNQYSDATFITSTVGCTVQQSIVFMPNGLMFQSDKGIWLLGRDLSTTYIGAPVEQYNSNVVLSALNIPGTNQVRFTLDNGVTLMYDYYYGQWGTFNGIPAISSTLYQSLHTYINASGAVFQETPGAYTDNSSPVLMSFTTAWINLAGLQGYQRFYFMYLLGRYISPFKLNVGISYNYNSTKLQTVLVTPNSTAPAWGGDNSWGGSPIWGGTSIADQTAGNVFQVRVFPTLQQCESFQITATEIYDPSFGVAAGAGLTLSGLNLIIGAKRGYRTNPASRNFG